MTDPSTNGLANPFELAAEEGFFWLRGNLHSHTTNSDGRASPQERVDGYVGQGYGFLCVSDHYNITRIDELTCPDNFVLIQGAELHPKNPFGGQVHHFVCLNIHEDMDTTRMPPQLVIDEVNGQGGSVWLAHPYWSAVNILRDTLPLHGFAGVEVFNTTCRHHGRGESSVHWDDWMSLEDRLYPALANDDSHAPESENHDTYQGWTVARVKERSADAILEALVNGATYTTTGPEIHDIRITEDGEGSRKLQTAISCSEAIRITAVCDSRGTDYEEGGRSFESASFDLPPSSRWVRFEIVGPDGSKAWSNPFDLTAGTELSRPALPNRSA